MSAARFILLAAIVVVGLTAADTPRLNGCNAATSTAGLYVNTTSTCSQIATCASAYTSCVGTTTNCTLAAKCLADRFACLNTAADNTTGCASLNNLKLSLMKGANGDLYNATDAYKSCVASSCRWLNETYSGAGGNCTLDYTVLCISPINVIVTLLLQGQFSGILASDTLKNLFAAALVRDLTRALKIVGIIIRRMFIAGSKRQSLQTLVVEVQVPGVSSKNTAFAAAFAALQSSGSSWATDAAAAYASATGGTLTVLKIGTGTSSAAFSSIPVPSNTTAKPSSAPTTKSPGSSNVTSAPTTKSTTKRTTGSSGSGAASRSMMVAAAIAAVSAALLF